MELHCLGSSSAGNCYILQNNNEALVIEAGVSLKEVKKAVDFNVSKIVGVLVSHEHGDHANYLNEFTDSRIQAFGSFTTLFKLRANAKKVTIIEAGCKQQIGNFTILPFDVKHDAAEPIGFLINHPETGNVLFATDTYYLPYTFAGLNNILIECNYSNEILQRNIANGSTPAVLHDRTFQSHMSFETCKEALLANDIGAVNNIVLLHLSSSNSNEKEFVEEIHGLTKKTVYAARKGLKINFNKTPF